MFGEDFYPTPPAVGAQMLARISRDARYFLEPSAGKGDLVRAIRTRFGDRVNVDCIEASPDLCAVLTGQGHTLVGTDWLSYDGVSYQDAVVMNPPFADGDTHLLRAWDYLYHGEIVCLLNAETVRNPHTAERRRLAKLVADYGDVTFLGDCFKQSERRTSVDVAMVYLKKVAREDKMDLWGLPGEEREKTDALLTSNDLVVHDRIENMQSWYEAANDHMTKAIHHLHVARQFMSANDISIGSGKDGWFEQLMTKVASFPQAARADFLREHRVRAWVATFGKTDFHLWLDHKQREAFERDVRSGGHFPFTASNIRSTLENVFLQRKRLFEQSVSNVFDALTSYFPGNTNHTEGWKSNDGYKVNKKIVFPYGCEHDATFDSFSLYYRTGSSLTIYDDLDRILCVLGAKPFATTWTVGETLRKAFSDYREDRSMPRVCQSEHFDIRFFKKGTVHLVWRSPELWQAFNVTAAAGKAWLGQDRKAA